jgi:N-acyl-L-homoserine lactone synthetase
MGYNQFHSGQQGMFGGQRMIQSSVPPSLLQDVQDSLLSRPLGSSPNVLNTKYQAR